MKTDWKKGDILKCIKTGPLEGNSKFPNLIMDNEYTIQEIIQDRDNHDHIDVGIPSTVEYVTSWDTKEELPDGDWKHWCHPSRFEKI